MFWTPYWVPTLGWAWSGQEPQRLTAGRDGRVCPSERMISGVGWDPHSKTPPGTVQVLAKLRITIRIRYTDECGVLIIRHSAEVNPPGSWASGESGTSLLSVLGPCGHCGSPRQLILPNLEGKPSSGDQKESPIHPSQQGPGYLCICVFRVSLKFLLETVLWIWTI